MKQFKLVGTAGAWYTFKRADGTDVKFLSKDFEKKLEEVDGLKDKIRFKINLKDYEMPFKGKSP